MLLAVTVWVVVLKVSRKSGKSAVGRITLQHNIAFCMKADKISYKGRPSEVTWAWVAKELRQGGGDALDFWQSK